MEWSSYQNDIFNAVENSRKSLIIEAVAGSGKTTTIVEAIRHVPSTQSVVFLAFNKAIADELKRRVQSPNARCMTLHAAGLNAWKQHLAWDAQGLQVDGRKTTKIVGDVLTWQDRERFGGVLTRLVSIAKSAGIVPNSISEWRAAEGGYGGLTEDSSDEWEDLIDFYGINIEEDEDIPDAIDCARKVLAESIKRSREVVDYDDMLYMPIIAGAVFEKFDVVFLDEAQDVSNIQVEMVARMQKTIDIVTPIKQLKRGEVSDSRVIAVGDPHQAIYGFRGALCDSMENIAKRFHCEPLPLSVSYRCPKAVVRRAQRWVPHILWWDGASEGIDETPREWDLKMFRPGDAILCRNARPVVECAFLLIRHKVAARVIGRDIGQGLISLIKKLKPRDLPELELKLKRYRERELVRVKGDAGKMAAVDDKLETLDVFIDEVALHYNAVTESPNAIPELIQAIESLFGDGQDMSRMVTCSTVHKSKGLEFDRVFVLDADLYMPSKWARQPWERRQEANLSYVACTRAKRELRYVSSDVLRAGANPQPIAEQYEKIQGEL